MCIADMFQMQSLCMRPKEKNFFALNVWYKLHVNIGVFVCVFQQLCIINTTSPVCCCWLSSFACRFIGDWLTVPQPWLQHNNRITGLCSALMQAKKMFLMWNNGDAKYTMMSMRWRALNNTKYRNNVLNVW